MIVANIYSVTALSIASVLAVSAFPPNIGPILERLPSDIIRSNGTNWFFDTVIMISISGMRNDYIDNYSAQTLLQMARDGVRAEYMTPSFPSTTFANQYTMVTGLYPENHGIISNSFYDPVTKDTFDYRDLENIKNPKWWGGEPIWTTVVKAGMRSAVHMLPGSSVASGHKSKATYVDESAMNTPLYKKADQILRWLDMPDDMRSQFIGAYVSDVAIQGRKFGPDSRKVRAAMADVDNMMKWLFDGLKARNLDNIVNVLVVSDHGMKEVDPSNAIMLDKIIDLNSIASNHGYPLALLTPRRQEDIIPIYEKLKIEAIKTNNFDVYLKNNVPPAYHFSKSPRISPIVCIPRLDYVMTTSNYLKYIGKGANGYRNTDVGMRGSFLARGPAIRVSHGIKVPAFTNVNLYNIMAYLLKISPIHTDGDVDWLRNSGIFN